MGNKIFRLSGYMLMLAILVIFLSCSRGVSPAEEQSTTKAPGSNSSASAENQENMPEMFQGIVVEVIDAGRHIYVQIDTGEKRVWVAVPAFDGKVGDTVSVPPGVPSADFHSKTLNRNFEMIYFVGAIHRANVGTGE